MNSEVYCVMYLSSLFFWKLMYVCMYVCMELSCILLYLHTSWICDLVVPFEPGSAYDISIVCLLFCNLCLLMVISSFLVLIFLFFIKFVFINFHFSLDMKS